MRIISTGLLIVACCGLAACTDLGDDSDQEQSGDVTALPLGSSRPDANGLDTYKVTAAPLLTNRTIANNLLTHSLTSTTLTQDVYKEICKSDHNSHEAFRYLVKCALAVGHDIAIDCYHSGYGAAYGNGTEMVTGELGLVDGWRTGTCDSDCQQWVSACMLAHSSFAGETGVLIQLGGSNAAMTAVHDPSYVNDEGAYWGDIFNEDGTGQKRYGCSGAQAGVLYTSQKMNVNGTAVSVKLMSRACGYYDASGSCKVCGSTTIGTGNACRSSDSGVINYFMNLDANFTPPKVKTCASTCGTFAGINDGFYNNCGDSNRSSRVLTVWRK
jgi:hypothetical protein